MVTRYEQIRSKPLNYIPPCKSYSFLRFGSDHSEVWAVPDSETPGIDTDASMFQGQALA